MPTPCIPWLVDENRTRRFEEMFEAVIDGLTESGDGSVTSREFWRRVE